MSAKEIAEVYATIDDLQQAGDYEELRQIAKYALDAIVNDGEE